MKRWKHYIINNTDTFRNLLGTEGDWPSDEEIKVAGFNPKDEELVCSLLAQDWNEHKAGARILHGLIVNGHPFAVEL